MDEPAWNIIYQDDEIKFGQADGEYALFYDGNTYRLSPIRYEPGINIEGPDKTPQTRKCALYGSRP
ncbi:MAG: hypothetical protein IKD90_05835 [Clostridiales bacterium]|nr:hypothetical protein [Clostridiales bacterium]